MLKYMSYSYLSGNLNKETVSTNVRFLTLLADSNPDSQPLK